MRGEGPGYGAPIVWDARERGYRYADPDFSIQPSVFSAADLERLREVRALLRQFAGLPVAAGVDGMVVGLERALRHPSREAPAIAQFEYNPVAHGLDWLAPLYGYVREARAVQLTYQPFTEPAPYRRVVSPYLLREYNNRWFLIGYDHHESLVRTFALDRIREAEPYLLQPFYRSPAFDAAHRYRHVVGVSIPDGASPQTVRLRVAAEHAPYLRTKPLHPSQTVELETADGPVLRLFVIHNIELENCLLSYGEHVEVLEPASLRQRLRERISALYRRYSLPG